MLDNIRTFYHLTKLSLIWASRSTKIINKFMMPGLTSTKKGMELHLSEDSILLSQNKQSQLFKMLIKTN
jgi:hypothetical protein